MVESLAAPRHAGTVGVNPHRGVRDASTHLAVAPARVRSSGGPCEETEDSAYVRRQATRRAIRLGARGPGGDLPAERTTADRLPGHPEGQGSPWPPRPGREGVHGRIQVRLRPGTRGSRGETRCGRDRGGDVLQTQAGARVAVRA